MCDPKPAAFHQNVLIKKLCAWLFVGSGIQEEEGHDTDGLKLQESHKFHEVHEAEVTEPQASDNEKDLAKNFSNVKKTECSNSSHGFQEKPLDPLLECSEKDVIMVETTTSMQAERHSNADPQSNGNLADLQASTTSAMETTYHHNKLEAAAHEDDEFITSEDERIREIGKSNLDKWLHVLFEDAGSPRISTDDASQIQPTHNSILGQQPPLSPDLSNISMAALRGSIELDGGRDNHVCQPLQKNKSIFCSMHCSDELYMSVMGFVFSVMFNTLFIFLDNRSSSGRMMQQASQRDDGEG
jgi:hypothetical protein